MRFVPMTLLAFTVLTGAAVAQNAPMVPASELQDAKTQVAQLQHQVDSLTTIATQLSAENAKSEEERRGWFQLANQTNQALQNKAAQVEGLQAEIAKLAPPKPVAQAEPPKATEPAKTAQAIPVQPTVKQ